MNSKERKRFCLEILTSFDWLAYYYSSMEEKLPVEFDNWVIDEMELLNTLIGGQKNPAEAHREAMRRFRQKEFRNFSRSLRYSFVVLLFVTIENQLNRFCDELRVRKGFPFHARDLKGAPIESCGAYLAKVEDIKLGDMKQWQRLRNLQKVRNCIVHELGSVANLDKKKVAEVKEFIETEKGISIGPERADSDEAGMLLIQPEFCQSFAKDARTLFADLFAATKLF